MGRARTHVSNLAHFLKTPLSVLAAEAEAHERDPAAAPLSAMVKRQVFSMRRQVDHYLARARAAGSLDVLGNRTQLSAVMDDLSRVIARIHAVRAIVIDAECDDDIYFRGERQDLEEMLGNLIDNGCKWAKSRVRVRCEKAGGRLILTVEDDGPGLSAQQRVQVGARGEKAGRKRPRLWPGPGHRAGHFQALRGFFRPGRKFPGRGHGPPRPARNSLKETGR